MPYEFCEECGLRIIFPLTPDEESSVRDILESKGYCFGRTLEANFPKEEELPTGQDEKLAPSTEQDERIEEGAEAIQKGIKEKEEVPLEEETKVGESEAEPEAEAKEPEKSEEPKSEETTEQETASTEEGESPKEK